MVVVGGGDGAVAVGAGGVRGCWCCVAGVGCMMLLLPLLVVIEAQPVPKA